MNPIVVSSVVIDSIQTQTANALELHEFLGIGRDFSNWIKARIKKYGFIENQDYIKTSRKVGNATAYDYHITLDMAKELCMVENNEKGREARRYFIECEKNLQIGQEQFDELKKTILAQNAIIAQQQQQKQLPPPQVDGYLLDLIGQIARFLDESKSMEELIQSRRASIEGFMNAFVKKSKNAGLLEQSQRKSENVYYGQLKLKINK